MISDFEGGINPPSYTLTYENVPCKCRRKHENNEKTWHWDKYPIGCGIMIDIKRCNKCSEILIQQSVAFKDVG